MKQWTNKGTSMFPSSCDQVAFYMSEAVQFHTSKMSSHTTWNLMRFIKVNMENFNTWRDGSGVWTRWTTMALVAIFQLVHVLRDIDLALEKCKPFPCSNMCYNKHSFLIILLRTSWFQISITFANVRLIEEEF